MTDQSIPDPTATLDEMTAFNRTGFGTALGLEFLELTADVVRAQWTVSPTQHQLRHRARRGVLRGHRDDREHRRRHLVR